MRLEQLHYLQIVAKEKSINTAAKKLYMSPQALSRSLKSAEDDLKIKLFERSRYGVILTKQGQDILEATEIFLQEIERIRHETEEKSFTEILSGELSLLANPGFGVFSPNVLSDIYLHAPDLQLDIVYNSFPKVIQLLSEHCFEFALVNISFVDDKCVHKYNEDEFDFYNLGTWYYYCKVSNKSAIAKYKTISLKTLENYPWIMAINDDDTSFLNISKGICKPKRIINERNSYLANQLVRDNLGIAFVPFAKDEHMKNFSDSGIVYVKLSDNIRTDFGIICNKAAELSPKAQAMVDIIKTT